MLRRRCASCGALAALTLLLFASSGGTGAALKPVGFALGGGGRKGIFGRGVLPAVKALLLRFK